MALLSTCAILRYELKNPKLWDSSAQKFWHFICYKHLQTSTNKGEITLYMYKGQLFWTFCRGSYMQMRCDQTLQKQSLVLLCQRLVIPGTWLVTFQLFFRWAVKLCDSWEYHFFCFAFRGLFKIFSAIWDNGKVISFSQCKTFGFMKDKKGKKKNLVTSSRVHFYLNLTLYEKDREKA